VSGGLGVDREEASGGVLGAGAGVIVSGEAGAERAGLGVGADGVRNAWPPT